MLSELHRWRVIHGFEDQNQECPEVSEVSTYKKLVRVLGSGNRVMLGSCKKYFGRNGMASATAL